MSQQRGERREKTLRKREEESENMGEVPGSDFILYFFSNNSHGHAGPSACRTLRGQRCLQTCPSASGSARTPSH